MSVRGGRGDEHADGESADGRVVFTVAVDSAAQTATFDLNDQLDHATGFG